ncbi:MAG: hypothetical protein UY92_C0007G0002 [Candidatus Magasanikbacteria bacterium GW2011_GWA2_56_11]|uniref:GHMP kinase n=1 Tax=Candidatus Magasanikbacteria bacterium GW2011_GWA2_56_11 TaxID=1619044 RepID=A0A0G1YFY8_9BACT|nr:MAG: hypothetical protein UY92_C0007G0002 [Candidatus Magasanikbacteria bacterium GW2011_GWA2_56_11]
MIVTRTPFRLPLGGGSTDLPAYYEAYGGFVFSVAVNLYMYVGLNRPPIDNRIRVKYSASEEVETVEELKHNSARAALERTGLREMVEISSMADVPDGTGLGSSGSYLVGLLNALHAFRGDNLSQTQLAEEAFSVAADDLKLPDGKQDFYLAACGNFCVLRITPKGAVDVHIPPISLSTQQAFEARTLLFYTGVRRSSVDILRSQETALKAKQTGAIELKHGIKRLGEEILAAFVTGDLDRFGRLMDEHWRLKKQMSEKMSSDRFDEVYAAARQAGALGGKILGAGGGGFFLAYCQEGAQAAVRSVFAGYGMREIEYRVDGGGTQVIVNRPRSVNTI